jgi:coenzyme F420-reducing hydrogenase gamma subunit
MVGFRCAQLIPMVPVETESGTDVRARGCPNDETAYERMVRQTRALAMVECEHDGEPCYGCATCFARETVRVLDTADPPLTARQRFGLRMVLLRVCSWTSARYDQHLRYEIGDQDADAVISWLERHGLDPYVDKSPPTVSPTPTK